MGMCYVSITYYFTDLQVTCEMFYDAALRYSEGNISLFNMFEDKKAPEADKNHDASIGTVSG